MAYVTSFERYGKELWLKKGIEEGMEKGIEKGMEKGIEKGIEKGMEKGAEQRAKAIAIRMLSAGLELDLVAKLTQLPIKEIKQLKP